jgi:hypothetical protein
MSELEALLDNYFKARSIAVDDQRTIAQGTLDMVKAQVAIENFIVSCTIAEFCKMNIENPTLPVNIDEVKRRALAKLEDKS